MALKLFSAQTQTGQTVYCKLRRMADDCLRENSAAGGNAIGDFYAAPTDPYLPMPEKVAIARGTYEVTDDLVPYLKGYYRLYCWIQSGAAPDETVDEFLKEEEFYIDNDAAAAAPGTLLEKVQGLVKDVSGKLESADWTDAIASALKRYSTHNPKSVAVDVAGTGLHDYDLPVAWVAGFSEIKQIEFPLAQVPEALLDPDDFSFYLSTTGLKLRIVTFTPDAGESFRVTFTVPRLETEIEDNDLDAFANLAASICFEILAGRYVDTSNPAIQADAVNYRTKSGEAASRAKALLKFYKDHMGIQEDSDTPPSVAISNKVTNYPGGQGRLTHNRWARDRR
jgi:hypothetical protein